MTSSKWRVYGWENERLEIGVSETDDASGEIVGRSEDADAGLQSRGLILRQSHGIIL